MLKWLFYSIDLFLFALSPFVALLLRQSVAPFWGSIENITPYALVGIVVAGTIFLVASTNRSVWKHTSLPDFLRILFAVTISILITLTIVFVMNRTEGLPRSIPIIQWGFAIAAMIGVRLAARLLLQQPTQLRRSDNDLTREHVLVVGLNHVASLYLRCVSDLSRGRVSVEGILEEDSAFKGRSLQHHKVIGTPADLQGRLSMLRMHGIEITRIVIAMQFDKLSRKSQDILLEWEASGAVKLDLFEERLGFSTADYDEQRSDAAPVNEGVRNVELELANKDIDCSPLDRREAFLKRSIDVVGSLFLAVILSPFIFLAAILVAVDLGMPLIFWQQRPGLHGRPFRVYKFRTMAPSHVNYGNRDANLATDAQRMSIIGCFLRRTRMDELPQLYHIFVGEMSFVGPRPLLPAYQPENGEVRLCIRPGITGWAQVNGGDRISADEKLALDVEYLDRMSLKFDIQIILKTIAVAFRGDKVNENAIKKAMERLCATKQSLINKSKKAVGGYNDNVPSDRIRKIV